MKIVKLEQGSHKWLKWRSEGIGASDIAVLMGAHPTKTPLMLYNEKCSFSQSTFVNKAMMYGNQQEPLARSWLENHFNTKLDTLCAQDKEYPFLKVSFDAINLKEKLLSEIKSPYSQASLQKLMSGNIPDMYMYQLQWQIMLSEFEQGYLSPWDSQKCNLFPYESDKKIHDKMKQKAVKFWEDLRRGIAPPPIAQDYQDLSNIYPDLEEKIKVLKAANKHKKELEKVIKDIKEEVQELGNENNFQIYDLKMTWCKGVSSLDYKAMKADGIDIDKYVKFGTPFYRPRFN